MSGEGIGRLHSDDLVWTRGAVLQAGDRVRLGSRLGFVGFRNDDGAPMRLGNNLTQPVFICGRALPTGGVCGGSDGKGRACRSCLRFLAEHRGSLVEGGRTPLSVHVEFDEAAQPSASQVGADAAGSGERGAASGGHGGRTAGAAGRRGLVRRRRIGMPCTWPASSSAHTRSVACTLRLGTAAPSTMVTAWRCRMTAWSCTGAH